MVGTMSEAEIRAVNLIEVKLIWSCFALEVVHNERCLQVFRHYQGYSTIDLLSILLY